MGAVEAVEDRDMAQAVVDVGLIVGHSVIIPLKVLDFLLEMERMGSLCLLKGVDLVAPSVEVVVVASVMEKVVKENDNEGHLSDAVELDVGMLSFHFLCGY